MQYKESERLELKSTFGEWKEIIISLSAFANKEGGMVIVGLNDQGQPLHIQTGKRTIEDLVSKIKNHTNPILYPSINIKTFGLGEIIEISVPKSDYKPVFAFDKAWMRVGKSNVKLSAEKLRELILRYGQKDFDNQPLDMHKKEVDLDESWLNKMATKGFTLSKSLNYADYLCLTKVNTQFPNAVVKAARFKGNKPVRFLDTRDFNQGLLSITDKLLDFIKKNIRLQYIITGKAERE